MAFGFKIRFPSIDSKRSFEARLRDRPYTWQDVLNNNANYTLRARPERTPEQRKKVAYMSVVWSAIDAILVDAAGWDKNSMRLRSTGFAGTIRFQHAAPGDGEVLVNVQWGGVRPVPMFEEQVFAKIGVDVAQQAALRAKIASSWRVEGE